MSWFLPPLLSSRVCNEQLLSKQVKKTIRETKDAIRDLRHKNAIRMDEEEQRMAKILREKNKDGGANMPEAIKQIVITVGQKETDDFQKENDYLREKGDLPFALRMRPLSPFLCSNVRVAGLCEDGEESGKFRVSLDSRHIRQRVLYHARAVFPLRSAKSTPQGPHGLDSG